VAPLAIISGKTAGATLRRIKPTNKPAPAGKLKKELKMNATVIEKIKTVEQLIPST